MGMQLNTGDTGRAVSPAADGSLYSKIFGSGCYVLSGGNELKAEIQSNNLIKIYDGDLIMQGRHSYIPASDSDNVTINNGSQGMNRKDLIVARYTKDSTGVEDVTLQVVQGTATSGAATAPGYTDGDILKGATAKDFPLYEVSLTGINITEVKKLFKVLGTNEDLTERLAELNGKIARPIANLGNFGSSWNVYTDYVNVGNKFQVINNEFFETTSGSNAMLNIKEAGTYLLLASSEFGAATGTGGAAWIAIKKADGSILKVSNTYVYGGTASANISYLFITDSPVSLELCAAKSVGSGTIQNKGTDLFQCMKIS